MTIHRKSIILEHTSDNRILRSDPLWDPNPNVHRRIGQKQLTDDGTHFSVTWDSDRGDIQSKPFITLIDATTFYNSI
jgi:hypothetical protein